MEQGISAVESAYGIRPKSIIKSKYFYIISAEGQLYRLYPMSEDAEKNELLVRLNEAVYSDGAPVCPVVKTLDGEALTVFDEKQYMLARVPKGRMPDIERPEDVLKAAAVLGAFHAALRKHNVKCDIGLSAPYDKGIRALKNIKSIINRKNKVNETDKAFLRSYDKVLTLAENAAKALHSGDIACTYAYGTPKEENFIICGGADVLTNWNSLKVSHFLEDTAYFYKRYFKKVKPPVLTGEKLMAAYTAENPLSDKEISVFENILSYPEKYIAVVGEYYGKHRPFAPLYVKEKLDKELAALGILP